MSTGAIAGLFDPNCTCCQERYQYMTKAWTDIYYQLWPQENQAPVTPLVLKDTEPVTPPPR